jgi:hypothetical protein
LIYELTHRNPYPKAWKRYRIWKQFNCQHSQLQSLPESLAELPTLKMLNARKNPLTHIPQPLREKEGLELLVDSKQPEQ